MRRPIRERGRYVDCTRLPGRRQEWLHARMIASPDILGHGLVLPHRVCRLRRCDCIDVQIGFISSHLAGDFMQDSH